MAAGFALGIFVSISQQVECFARLIEGSFDIGIFRYSHLFALRERDRLTGSCPCQLGFESVLRHQASATGAVARTPFPDLFALDFVSRSGWAASARRSPRHIAG